VRRLHLGLLIHLCLLASGPAAQASEALPAGRVGEHIRGYLDAVNADDGGGPARFRDNDIATAFAESVPPTAFARYFTNLRHATGGVELVAVKMKTGSPDIAELALRDRIYGALHGLELTFEPDGEQRVTEFEPGPAPAWALATTPKLSPDQIAAETEALVERGCAAGVFSGAILVAHGDEVLVEAACGEADKRHHVKNDVDTRFNLGSMNKMFTAVAVMQLVDAGKVSLDDPLDKYVDESWLPNAVASRITIRQLLAHRSGLGEFTSSDFRTAGRGLYRRLSDYKPLLSQATLAFEPGSRFSYSDLGMMFLGVVIEQASGEDYFDYVRVHVFAPAGMTRTGSYAQDEPTEDLAAGYGYAPDSPYGWRDNAALSPFRGMPAGGGYSTVGDLYRFARALRNGTLVSGDSLRLLWARQPTANYGAGFEVHETAAGKIVGHSGLFAGVSTRLELYLDKDYTAVVLGNIDAAAPTLMDALREPIARAARR